MRTCIVYRQVAAALVFAEGALSTETLLSKIFESCKDDAAKYCRNAQPKQGRLLACIYDHDDVISFECGMALNEATLNLETGVDEWNTVFGACEADYEIHCPTSASGRSRILKCLSRNVHQIGGVSRGSVLALERAGLL